MAEHLVCNQGVRGSSPLSSTPHTFLLENTLRSRARSTTPEIWERMGTTQDAVLPSLMEAAANAGTNQFAAFQASFFAKLVPNVRKLGLLDANNGYLRKGWAAAGLLEFEFADDTSADYESYDEVAKDRAESAISNAATKSA